MNIAAWIRTALCSLIAVSLLIACLVDGEAHAQDRVALVIGNSAYSHAPKLPNPVNDSDAVSLLLKSVGFSVVETRHDLSGNEMRRAFRDFADKTRNADMARGSRLFSIG